MRRAARARMNRRVETTDHVTIRQWVEQRRGTPAVLQRADGHGSSLRIIFPNHQEPPSVRPIDWQQFFEEFEREELVFVHELDNGRAGPRYSPRLVKRRR